MGYTHYWDREALDASSPAARGIAYGRLAMDAKTLIANFRACGHAVAGPLGTGEPEITEGRIAFNGSAAERLDYESFVWDAREEGWNFVKTAHRPYDILVTAVLIRAKRHYGNAVAVTSDGSWDDWRQGRVLVSSTFDDADDYCVLASRNEA